MSRFRTVSSVTRAVEGSVLLWALLFTVITSGMIIAHATYLAANRRDMHVRYQHQTLADDFARAGLTDALVWFQKQPNQPVAAFTPRSAPNADPPLLETVDPSIGLVREFEVHGNLWARYEVRTGEAFDISAERGLAHSGSVWDLGARGYLYRREDPVAAFDQSPNQVIATDYLRSEMRGIPILPPAIAALNIDDPTQLDIGPLGRLIGGAAPAVAYPAPASLPPLGSLPASLTATLVSGTPAALPQVQYGAGAVEVFSMELDQLKSLADFVFEAGDAGTAGALALGTGGDGNGSAFASPWPQGKDKSSGAKASSTGASSGTSTSSGAKPGLPPGLIHWWATVVQTLPSTSEAPLHVPQLGTTPVVDAAPAEVIGTVTTNALGWATRARGRLAVGAGQTTRRITARSTRSRAVYVDGDLVLDATTPLTGRLLLIVDGDLTIQEGNVSDVQGMIYVTGSVVIEGDFRLEGTMIVRQGVKIGHGTQGVWIRFDQSALDMLKNDLERYRLSRSVRPGWTR